MGGSKAGCNGSRDIAIEQFFHGIKSSRDNVKARQPEKTMQLFQQMQQEGMTPDRFTFVPVLNACANLRALEVGRVHS